MDGDGSIQVNHWRKLSLQYRLVIKLKNTQSNLNMLRLVSKHIGGKVRMVGNFVIWVENFKKNILLILKIFEKYPPLTKRIKSQIQFMYTCIEKNDVLAYLNTRSNKYVNSMQSIEFGSILNLKYFRE